MSITFLDWRILQQVYPLLLQLQTSLMLEDVILVSC
jgi:hypothetical protein